MIYVINLLFTLTYESSLIPYLIFLQCIQVPIFSKREDMFLTLCEYSVPMLRATWFIKMTSAYHESKVAESKIKKRQQPDIAQGK